MGRQRIGTEVSEQLDELRLVPAVPVLVGFITILVQDASQCRCVVLQLGDTELLVYLHDLSLIVIALGCGCTRLPWLADGREAEDKRYGYSKQYLSHGDLSIDPAFERHKGLQTVRIRAADAVSGIAVYRALSSGHCGGTLTK